MAMNEIFVYGTLKRDHYNNDLLGDSQLLGNYETLPQWGLISLGSFPGMVPSNKAVKGEVYLVDEDTMERLDLLEGVAHGLYSRRMIYVVNPVTKVKREVYAYIYNTLSWTSASETMESWD
jgi:gamma-glutamylcyclotransferase (GGCT)/AIG2-like uncharacterized protein YtfP